MKNAGKIEAKGYSWDIQTKVIGGGIYRVWLKRGERAVIIEEQSDLPKFEQDILAFSEALRG